MLAAAGKCRSNKRGYRRTGLNGVRSRFEQSSAQCWDAPQYADPEALRRAARQVNTQRALSTCLCKRRQAKISLCAPLRNDRLLSSTTVDRCRLLSWSARRLAVAFQNEPGSRTKPPILQKESRCTRPTEAVQPLQYKGMLGIQDDTAPAEEGQGPWRKAIRPSYCSLSVSAARPNPSRRFESASWTVPY